METSPVITGHLSPELAQIFLQGLPQIIRNGLEMRAKTINYPVWAVIEMARCLRHATRMQAISMKRLYPLSIASPSSTSDARFGFCDRLCVIYDRGVRSHSIPNSLPKHYAICLLYSKQAIALYPNKRNRVFQITFAS